MKYYLIYKVVFLCLILFNYFDVESGVFASSLSISSSSATFSTKLNSESASTTSSTTPTSTSTSSYKRPELITNALKNNDIVYYFGIGSNMLKSKVINRGLNGSKIEIIDMQPGYVRNYRLAFNVPGFPPLEPAMGGIEPIATVTPTLVTQTNINSASTILGSDSRGLYNIM